MGKLIDLTNQTFGDWLVLYRNGSTSNKAALWRCKCQICGLEKDIVSHSLVQGRTTKCRACATRNYQQKEYMSSDPIYTIYAGMRQRCLDKNHVAYENYGGRGISVCDEWLTDFQSFARWGYENGYQRGLSIDRIDVNGNYEPSNCRFITLPEQASNKRSNHYIEVDGETLCLAEACRKYGLCDSSIRGYQHDKGCTFQEAFDHMREYRKNPIHHPHLKVNQGYPRVVVISVAIVVDVSRISRIASISGQQPPISTIQRITHNIYFFGIPARFQAFI